MSLHEVIEDILSKERRPLLVEDIVRIINDKKLYLRKDEEKLDSSQVRARIRKYNHIFQNVNGYIILTSEPYWKDILTVYWYLADVLRGILSISELQFILASAFYFKRIQDRKSVNPNFNERAQKINLPRNANYYFSLKNEGRITFEHILSEYNKILSRANLDKEIEMLEIISKLDTRHYDGAGFGNIFEYLLNLSSLDSNKLPVAYTPQSLRELMILLLHPVKNGTLYDPVCGTGGLLIEAVQKSSKKLRVNATEINFRVALLCLMNFEMHEIYDAEIVVENSLNSIDNGQNYDYILGDLPVNGVANYQEYSTLFNRYGISTPASGNSFGAITLFILNKLKPAGKAVITVSESFLFKKGRDEKIRNILVESDIIEAVVGLPYGALRPNTEAKAAIIVLNANKIHRGKIKFLRAKAISSDKTGLDLNVEQIIDGYLEKSIDQDSFLLVDRNDLLDGNNLSAFAYDTAHFLTKQMLQEGSGRLLSELVDIHSGIIADKAYVAADGELPYIKIENLSSEVLNVFLDNTQITSRVNYDPKFERHIIKEECLLVARIGDNLKPTFFRPSARISSLLHHNGVYSIIPNKLLINLEYLYYQLYSDYVQEQLKRLRQGAVMPYISISALKQVIIPYVDLSAQQEFVRTQKANIVSAERFKVEEKIKLLGYQEEIKQTESDIVRTLVHQLRPTLLNIDLEVKKIKRIVHDNNLDNLKENSVIEPDVEIAHLIKNPEQFGLQDILEKLQKDTLQLNDVLSTVNKVMSFKLTEKDMQEVDLLNFFSDHLTAKKIELGQNYNIQVSGEHFISVINQASVKELIDQLVLNAISHAFTEDKKDKTISFRIKQSKDRGVAIIDYQNNGKPFKLSHTDFVTPFVKSQTSTGSGIGGNYIQRIVSAHKGKIIVREGQKTGFAVTIEIPISQNNGNE